MFQRLLVVLLISSAAAAAHSETTKPTNDQYITDPEKLRAVITSAAQKSGKRLDMLVDPKISLQMFADSILFAENFCDDPKEDCASLLGDTPALQKIVDAYLTDASALPKGTIESFASRLAGGGGRLGNIGWPSKATVDAGIIELPPEFHKAHLTLRHATETVPLGSNASAILMSPGNVEIAVKISNRLQWYQVVVERLKRTKLSSLNLADPPVSGGRIEPSSYCYVQPPPFEGPFALFNAGRAAISESTSHLRANEAPFVRQTSLNISVEHDSSINCGEPCKAALSSLLAEAVAIWRNGCQKCDANAIALITTMGTTWLDARAFHRLRLMSENSNVELDLNKIATVEQERLAPLPLGSAGPVGKGIEYYTDITSDHTIKRLICQLDNNAGPWVLAAKSYLCSQSYHKPDEQLRPSIVLKNGETACKKLAIACGLPFERVEINLGQYRFSIPYSLDSEILIGNDELETGLVRDMRRVILHEVGHWFGVPHAEKGGANKYLDIMAEYYEDADNCVSAHSLRMMSNAADLRWDYRVRKGGGALKSRNTNRQSR